MAETLLRTKLFVPPLRPNLVPRPQLIQRLNQGLKLSHKLTLISAPAGFGKTTLVSEWVEQLRLDAEKENRIVCRIAWLSLDEGDNDPVRFLTYFIAATNQVEGIGAGIGEGALGMLQSPQPSPTEAVLTSLINDITAIPYRVILVLDDYHIMGSSPVDDAFTFLLEHLPPQMHLVIATREDPDLPLARLRARGHLTEIRAVDLRFTSFEAAEFLNQVMGLALSEEEIHALEARTEGWIAGLQLAAISLQWKEDTSKLVRSFSGSHRLVLDYLIEEVLEQQPENIQIFLLQTAILNRFTGSLCDALTGQDNGQVTLEMLEHANLFIIPLDEERRWYRYHHLFADLLRQRLRHKHLDQVPTLHLRASVWYEQNGFTDEAIEHSLQKEDFERAAEMIEECADEIWQFGARNKLRRWLDDLPDEVLFENPSLCILHAGHMLFSGHYDAANQLLEAAEQALGSNTYFEAGTELKEPDQLLDRDEMKLWGRAAAVRAYLSANKGDLQGIIRYARQALEYLPESDVTWRSTAYDNLGNAYSLMGDVALAYQTRSEALNASKDAGNVYLILNMSLKLVVTLRNRGHLQRALDICQQQLELANQSRLSQTAVVGWLFALWGEVLAEKNELDRALQLAEKGAELTKRGKDVAMLDRSYLCLMRVLFSRWDLDNAEKIIQEMDHIALERDVAPWIANQMAAWQARIWLAQGKTEDAFQWMDETCIDIDGDLTPLHDFDYVVIARILIVQGRLDETTRLLHRLLETAEAGGRTSKLIEVLVLLALSSQAQGDKEQAITTLGKALTLAEPGGFIRIFVDEGPPMAGLLYEALAHGIAPDYVRRLLAAFPVAEPGQTDPSKSQAPESELIEPLSERELEVLQLIAEGLTNQEIATRLFLSLNTVKTHTRNIYGKLNVHRRTQAIARSQELGLLPRRPD
jgi:LuxR family maltose regulon positive regulatory protein